MTIELKQAAQQALEALEEIALAGMSGTGQESEEGMRDWHARQAWKFIGIAARALDPLHTAIQQAEAQQPVTGEPVQADSSGHLRVIASLGAALRRLSFAAQTTGGTAGPDAELQSAIGQAEQAMSLGGIGQAMFATTGPVGYMNAGQLYELQQGRAPYGYIYPQSGVGADIELFTHPAPGVPDGYVLVPIDDLEDAEESIDDYRNGLEYGVSDTSILKRLGALITAAQAQKT